MLARLKRIRLFLPPKIDGVIGKETGGVRCAV